MTMANIKNLVGLFGFVLFCASICTLGADEQPSVRLRPTDKVGPKTLEKLTQEAVVKNYVEAWKALDQALGNNDAGALDAYFIGIAKDKLSEAIQDQVKLGMQTHYQDRSHDLRILFYSPDGLSIELSDEVEYDVQILDHGKSAATRHVKTRYVAVLSPTEVKWKVRVLDATSN